jgi:S1-C subfamily serine protease
VVLSEAIVVAGPSVVQIAFVASDLSAELSQRIGRSWLVGALGTGFFVNDGAFVITARHVITEGRAQLGQLAAGRKGMVVGLAIQNSDKMRGNFLQVGFDVVVEDEANDLTLIRLQQNPFAGEVTSGIQIGDEMVALPVGVGGLVMRRPVDGEAVAVSGYPLNEPVLITTSGHVASAWASETVQVRPRGAPAGFEMPKMLDRYLVDVEVNPGNSGGPVYRVEDAGIIGVAISTKAAPVRGRVNDPAVYGVGLAHVVPAQYVVDLLNKHGVRA